MVFLQKKLSIPSLMPLSTIISMSISDNNSTLLQSFMLAILMQELKEVLQNLNDKFLN